MATKKEDEVVSDRNIQKCPDCGSGLATTDEFYTTWDEEPMFVQVVSCLGDNGCHFRAEKYFQIDKVIRL